MENWPETLKKRLKGKVALVACGNALRTDDGLGPFVAERLEAGEQLAIFSCETAPENFISPIIKSEPQVVIVLDTADLDAAPGTVRLVEPADIKEADFSTHAMSPALFMSVIKERTHAKLFLLAVQPLSTHFGEELTPEIQKAAEEIIDFFSPYSGFSTKGDPS
jgi:hydrogenase 3 maturation protease